MVCVSKVNIITIIFKLPEFNIIFLSRTINVTDTESL